MEVIRGFHNLEPRHQGCVATIGNFDGVHHGHQTIAAHLVNKGHELGLPSTLITFEPLPDEFFLREQAPARLTTFREKIAYLGQTRLDRVLFVLFNARLRELEPEYVIEQFLVRQMRIGYLVVGDDFRFGKNARGDYAMLERAGAEHGFGVTHIGTIESRHRRISSTWIREALAAGDFDLAAHLLGRRYSMTWRVIYGRQLGRQIGMPTANIRLKRYRSPLLGVFAIEVLGLDRVYRGVANIGVRPTVEAQPVEPVLEAHLFDFDRNIYGRAIEVVFRAKLRDERKFASLEALTAQLGRDAATAEEWFEADAAQ